MSKADATHFEDYSEQTKAKHEILKRYLGAYLAILGPHEKKIVYLDGFAGRGHYQDGGEVREGSPMLAMSLIASNPLFRKVVQPVFIESRDDHFRDLEAGVQARQIELQLPNTPIVQKGRFSEVLEPLRRQLDTPGGFQLATTFMFVDPCGVDGVDLATIAPILARPRCEAFIFLNSTGISRVLGLEPSQHSTLVPLFGSPERVGRLSTDWRSATTPIAREAVITDAYERALRESGKAQYVLPFRIEGQTRRATSHYLLHATKHPLGFRKMKEVMWRTGADSDSGEGRLELLQASAGDLSAQFKWNRHQVREDLLSAVAQRRQVLDVINSLADRPADRLVPSVYKDELKAMEADGLVQVYASDGTPTPASARRKNTLADDRLVQRA